MRLFLIEQYSAATPRLRAFLADHPSSEYAADAHYFLGAIALRQGTTTEAESQFRECVRAPRTRPLADGAALGIARCHFQRSAYRQCREACMDILGADPSTPRADEVYFLLGEASKRSGLAAEARQYFAKVLEFQSSPLAPRAAAELGGASLPVPRASPGGRYFVQVAALGSAGKAAEEASRLRQRGYSVQTAVVSSGGRDLHAVQVGPYGTQAEAERAAARLRAQGLSAVVKP
jgi:TolA-binding protein